MKTASRAWRDVLVRSSKSRKRHSQATVRRYYLKWRQEHELPLRCDNPECVFFKSELCWNGKCLPPILDHQNGNRFDNTPANLRFLCPNCDAQLDTRGGSNRGRVIESREDGYKLRNPDGPDGSIIVGESGVAGGNSTATAVGVGKLSEPKSAQRWTAALCSKF
jgi:hypothetical protein